MRALLALAVAATGTPLTMRTLRRLQAVDVPNARSSHDRPTLRGGGLAPAVAVMVALGVWSGGAGRPRVGVLAAVAVFGAIGLVEDLAGLPLAARFGLQVVGAAAALAGLLGGLGGAVAWRVAFTTGCLLWLVSFVNAFNFMDGIDGLSVAQAAVAGGSWYVVGRVDHAPLLAAGGLIVAAAAVGFAPFNAPRARVFLGDVGSYALGGALAALAVVGVRAGVRPEAVLAPLALYGADTGSTLVRRVATGQAWYLPHRDHAYQRLVRGGWSHARTTLTVAAWLAACSAAGAATLRASTGPRVVADAVVVALLAAYLALPGWLARRPRRETLQPAR
ncbi:MAG: glycosyltransferase family 4 protein [Acidimicrobiales bacterium]